MRSPRVKGYVQVWERAHGPVPEGFIVHHKDHDPTNNALDNLELLTHADHWQQHHAERGADWHSKGGKACWSKKVQQEYTCEVCGCKFMAYWPAVVCGRPCYEKRRAATGIGNGKLYDHVCAYCRTPFRTRYRTSRFCSRMCRNRGAHGSVLPDGRARP